MKAGNKLPTMSVSVRLWESEWALANAFAADERGTWSVILRPLRIRTAKGSGFKGNGASAYPTKGGKSFCKASYDGHVSDYSSGPKSGSKGKGYQGECWRCGKIGRKASECVV